MKQHSNDLILYADANIIEKDLIQKTFEQEGNTVYFVENGNAVMAAIEELCPTVLVLEVVLPLIDGIEICSELRKREEFKELLIVFVSERSEDFIQIAALDAGGDDYFIKPIRPRLLLSHIKALKRRMENLTPKVIVNEKASAKTAEMIHPILDIDELKRCAYVRGEEVKLPLKQFELLETLLSTPGKVFSRDSLAQKLWKNDNEANPRLVDVHIRKLRSLIGNDFAQTYKGIGYKVVF